VPISREFVEIRRLRKDRGGCRKRNRDNRKEYGRKYVGNMNKKRKGGLKKR
jgi:hypothetical protein